MSDSQNYICVCVLHVHPVGGYPSYTSMRQSVTIALSISHSLDLL